MVHLTGLFIIVLSSIFQFGCSEKDSIAEPTKLSKVDTTFSDIERNTYRAKKFGTHYWMVENFNGTKTAEGQNLQGVFVYDNNNVNAAIYGRLYTWSAAVSAAPLGWRLPTMEEWEELINSIGGATVAGSKLKERGTTHWNSPNTGATDFLGFTALPGGFRGPDGIYYEEGKHGDYWGTAINSQEPFCVYLYNTTANVTMEVSPNDKTSGIAFSVRYVKR